MECHPTSPEVGAVGCWVIIIYTGLEYKQFRNNSATEKKFPEALVQFCGNQCVATILLSFCNMTTFYETLIVSLHMQ